MLTRSCQLCGSSSLAVIIDLGHHPLADTFLPAQYLDQETVKYPLRVLLCEYCGYATLQYIVPADIRYKKLDYSYTSSNSPVSVSHFRNLALEVANRLSLSSDDLVVDIGSNVGTLLNAFREICSCRILGVEPAPNIARISIENNIPTKQALFDEPEFGAVIGEHDRAKAIVCTNTFNHASNLRVFVENVTRLLSDSGAFIFEVPYLLDLVRDTSFDTIYLEHVSYFSIKPLSRFFRSFGMSIQHVERTDYMGGSVRVYVQKGVSDASIVGEMIRLEEEAGVYHPDTYKHFMDRIQRLKFQVVSELYELKRRGERIIGIGAAAKGNTFLNYCKIDSTLLDFITDSSPLKIGKFTPGSHIPILSDDSIAPPVSHALILPWNIASFLKEKLKHLNLNFIIPKIDK